MPKIIAATFANQGAAGRGLATVAGALGRGLKQGAVVNKTEGGEIKFVEAKDMGAKQGAVTGGLIGAAVGLIAGPAVAVIGGGAIGAGIGSLAAKLRDSGFPDAQLRGLGEDLTPGSARDGRSCRRPGRRQGAGASEGGRRGACRRRRRKR